MQLYCSLDDRPETKAEKNIFLIKKHFCKVTRAEMYINTHSTENYSLESDQVESTSVIFFLQKLRCIFCRNKGKLVP